MIQHCTRILVHRKKIYSSGDTANQVMRQSQIQKLWNCCFLFVCPTMENELYQGLIIVIASIIFYSLVYLWTFRSHLLEATESQKNQIANAQNHDTDTVQKQDIHSPQNCYEYARCATSMINVTILSVGGSWSYRFLVLSILGAPFIRNTRNHILCTLFSSRLFYGRGYSWDTRTF